MSKIERRAILTGMAALPLAAPGLARGQTAATPARPALVEEPTRVAGAGHGE